MNAPPLILTRQLAATLDVIGDRWSLLILRATFNGRTRFDQYLATIDISRATLTRRLSTLIDNDILYKRPYQKGAKRFEYRLTGKGLGLFGASLLAKHWEASWGNQRPTDRLEIKHLVCGHTLVPEVVCRHCKKPVSAREVEWHDRQQNLPSQLMEIGLIHQHRRVRQSTPSPEKRDKSVMLADLIGDRWSLLILVAGFFGINRYDDFQRQLKISPGILSERLQALVADEVLDKQAYQNNPPRFLYKLTRKGRAIYPFILALRQWAMDWSSTEGSTDPLIHACCGQPLVVDVTCQGCGQKPWPQDVIKAQT